MAGLENIEAWLDTLDVGIAVLAGNAVGPRAWVRRICRLFQQ